MAQIVVDDGNEWKKEFREFMQEMAVDVLTTSRGNPQANGRAEKLMGIILLALKKYCRNAKEQATWNQQLPRLCAGVRFGKGVSKFSPYTILHGTNPVLEPRLVKLFNEGVDWSTELDDAVLAQVIIDRADALNKILPAAFGNRQIAQHRDSLRYARHRSGHYLRQLVKFQPGDLCYVMQRARNKTEPDKGSTILMVEKPASPGRWVLMGANGVRVNELATNMAKCHLPDVDTRLLTTQMASVQATRCTICKFADFEQLMLLCDLCNRGFHTFCLGVPDDIPNGAWFCPECKLHRTRLRPVVDSTPMAATPSLTDRLPELTAPAQSLACWS
jgi:hypothetical protein